MKEETKFIRLFPSLKNSHIDDKGRLHVISIMNNCLDNQKVKKVLIDSLSGVSNVYNCKLSEILKKLKLE